MSNFDPRAVAHAQAQEQWRRSAIAAMQQNPMAYLALTRQAPGQGFQLRPAPMQMPPMQVTAAPPAAQAAPRRPLTRAQAMGAFDKVINSGKRIVNKSSPQS